MKYTTIKLFFLLPLTIVFFNDCSKKEDNSNGVSNKPFTILGLGDSITEGKRENKSYLFPLWEQLYNAGYKAKFIGPNTYKHETKNIKNAGYSGKDAEFLDAITDSIYKKYTADIVLLHTGHNHFAEENPVAGIIAAQKSIISKIIARNPKVTIFLAQVITSGKLPKYSYIPALNEQIANLAIELQKKGLPIVLVNQAKNFNWELHCLQDKVHPNAKGAKLMATTWFESIDKKRKESSLQKQH